MQVARLAFLQYCRAKLEDERAICLAKKSITDALFRLRLELAPVSIPGNRYAREIGKYTMVSLDELNELPKGSYTFEEESIDRVMVQKYLDTLSDTERASLMLWAEGRRNREIMAATGIAHSYQVTRMIQRLIREGKAAIGYGGDDDGHA